MKFKLIYFNSIMFELFINGVLRVFLDCDRFNGYTLWVYSLRQAINFIIGCFFYFVVLLWNKMQLRIANQPHRYFAKLNKEIIFVPVSFRQAYIKFMY
ncbi:hypothetical protein FF18_14270 [Elizabethkingia anophelis]|nr:hypothetical protein FF18_14270 [Elizabethkingia anophelis]